MGLPLIDPSGKYGFPTLHNLTDLLALQINRTPRKQIFEDQITSHIKKYLHDFFAPHNALLTKYIGYNPYDQEFKDSIYL